MAAVAPETIDFSGERARMVERQIAAREIADERVLAAMREVPRHEFVPEGLQEFSYEDSALPIEAGQTISQPYIVARMAELAAVGPGDTVLEVGAGSGYAAAVLGRIAGRVFAIERHEVLARLARERMERLGYENVEIIHGDGNEGRPAAAPYDAILVAAGGKSVPEPLKQQLRIGGRLIIPLSRGKYQVLTRITRSSETAFESEEHGLVAFVPLVGSEKWPVLVEKPRQDSAAAVAEGESDMSQGLVAGHSALVREPPAKSTVKLIREAAREFSTHGELAQLIEERFADRRVVLMGEATHGTAEFYEARAAITEDLVAKHGFNIVAVEADWADAAHYDRYVRALPPRPSASVPFQRFPRWMWRNQEFLAFLRRLRALNAASADPEKKARFYGLDIYGLNESIEAVVRYLDKVDPEAAAIARQRYGCLTPFRSDPVAYGRMARNNTFRKCEAEVTAMLVDLLERRLDYLAQDGSDYFDAAQNALVVANAESYYAAIYRGAAACWNLRYTHMFATLERLLEHHGPRARAVVWAHNSHIGDARATDMGRMRGEINIGQLCRETWGAEVALIGFGTDRGTVAAASDWDGPMEIKRVRPGREDSYEGCCRKVGTERFLLDLAPGTHPELRAALSEPRLERYIGVIYRPGTEYLSHYIESELPAQFDAWVWFAETRAVTASPDPGIPLEEETYPTGL